MGQATHNPCLEPPTPPRLLHNLRGHPDARLVALASPCDLVSPGVPQHPSTGPMSLNVPRCPPHNTHTPLSPCVPPHRGRSL